MPKTTVGKWSLGLIIVMPLLFVLGTSFANSLYDSVAAGGTVIADISSRPALAITMLAGFAAGIAGFITGLIALFKQKDRAILVYASTIVGFLLVLYVIAEFAFPH